jgi:hypothetical protein
MRGSAFLLGAALLPAVFAATTAQAQVCNRSGLPQWVDEVQTYGMLPLLPQRAAKLNVSVNGVWAGIGTTDPVLPNPNAVPAVRAQFGTDSRAFVDACHKAGLVVASVVNGLEGFPALKKTWPKLEDMACRNREGKPVDVGEFILMCTNNPDWIQWEIDFGKRGIDLGADLLVVDTPMASSFASGGMLKAGFCPHCMAGFRKHLQTKFSPEELRQRLGLAQFDAQEIIRRLSSRQTLGGDQQPFLRTSPDDLLFREFIDCQEQASFDTRKLLIESLRQYAAQQGRKVAFSTNASDLGTQNPFGHWVRAIMFADLVDLFTYEQDQVPDGMPSKDVAHFPRGKWAAYHKLAYAIHHRRSPAVLHASAMGEVLQSVLKQGRTSTAWMGVQCAEAYAANGAYILFQIEPGGLTIFAEKCWAKAVEVFGFVQSHKNLFEGEVRSGSDLAVLFLFNDRGRTIPSVFPSYLGLAQALVEGNYPFDVVFGGDGRYAQDRLTPQDLQGYRSLLVPSPVRPTENQKAILRDFVKAGGTVVCQEPEALGVASDGKLVPVPDIPCAEGQYAFGKGSAIKLKGKITPTGTNDVGSEFFARYEPELRKHVGDLARKLGLWPVLDREPDGLMSAFPIVQSDRKRAVVHVVNYDVDYQRDSIRPQTAVKIRIPAALLPARDVQAELYVPGAAKPKPLEVARDADFVSCVIPQVALSASVVFSGRSADSTSEKTPKPSR